MTFMNEEERDALRRDIERQTREYLRKGKHILEVPHGVSGIPGNGLLNFRINNTECPQPRNTNNGLFDHSRKWKNKEQKP